MRHLKNYTLFEKTSLLNIGVPYDIMRIIQKDYEISNDAQWKNIKYKKDIKKILSLDKNLLISICKSFLYVSFSYDNEYYLETFELVINDDFGDEKWEKIDRKKTTIQDIINTLPTDCKTYHLNYGNWSPELSKVRKIKKIDIKFNDITNSFKRDFANNFTRIVKKLYGKKSNLITDIIINHLKNVKSDISSDEIRKILFINVERSKEVDKLKGKEKQSDPYELQNNFIKDNSLTIFDEYLIKFEDEYSNKYKEYLNIPIMIDKYSREKVMTSFCYYLWSEKLMEL